MALIERRIEVIEWTKTGTKAAGFLLSISKEKYRDGVGISYLLRNEHGVHLVFKGATRLNLLLSPADKGRFIEVIYMGEDATKEVREGMNRPKVFRVSVDDERTLKPNELGITDDDIPF